MERTGSLHECSRALSSCTPETSGHRAAFPPLPSSHNRGCVSTNFVVDFPNTAPSSSPPLLLVPLPPVSAAKAEGEPNGQQQPPWSSPVVDRHAQPLVVAPPPSLKSQYHFRSDLAALSASDPPNQSKHATSSLTQRPAFSLSAPSLKPRSELSPLTKSTSTTTTSAATPSHHAQERRAQELPTPSPPLLRHKLELPPVAHECRNVHIENSREPSPSLILPPRNSLLPLQRAPPPDVATELRIPPPCTTSASPNSHLSPCALQCPPARSVPVLSPLSREQTASSSNDALPFARIGYNPNSGAGSGFGFPVDDDACVTVPHRGRQLPIDRRVADSWLDKRNIVPLLVELSVQASTWSPEDPYVLGRKLLFMFSNEVQKEENESGKFCQKGCNYRKILDNVLATPPTLSKNKSRVKLVIEAKPPQITNDECPSVPTTPVAGGPSYAVPTKTIETNLGGTEGFTLHSSVSGKTYKQCLETTDEFRDKIEKGKHALVYFVKDEKNNIYIAKSYPSNDLTVTLHEELRHPNVERVLEHFQWTGRCWGVYEYCEQGSIVRHSQMVTRSWPPLSASRLWLCCRDLSCGLLHIHSKNVINCDIKLPNIFVTKDLRVVIGDFSASKRGPIAYTVAGTRAFNAPETTTGNGYGKEVDIWSTAVVIYGLCQGSLPCADVEKIPQCRPETLEFRVPIHPLLQDLLKRMFEPAAPKRITAQQMMEHPWITQDGRYPMSNIDSRAGLDSNIEQWLVSYKSP